MGAIIIKDVEAVKLDNSPQGVTVRRLIDHVLCVDVRFNSGYDGMRVAGRISRAMGPRDLSATGDFSLDEGDWQKVCDALRSPSPLNGMAPYPISPAHACQELVETVLDAKPKEKTK